MNINKTPLITIQNGMAELMLTKVRGPIRICDADGNHVSTPTTQSVDFDSYYIEWMITNADLVKLISQKFAKEEILELVSELRNIDVFLRNSEFYERKAGKEKLTQTVGNFMVHKYNEIFHSFEEVIDPSLEVKIIPKMGDFTIAPHMFILIKLNNPEISLRNKASNIQNNTPLGSGAKCLWNPSNQTLSKVAVTLASSSDNHRDDLVRELTAIASN